MPDRIQTESSDGRAEIKHRARVSGKDGAERREVLSFMLTGSVLKSFDPSDLARLKRHLCVDLGLQSLPTNAELMTLLGVEPGSPLASMLKRKPSRTLSGVAPVAVMTSPERCPHGTCLYCPGGVKFGTAQSYTGQEPAALRAAQHGFDPYSQVRSRLGQLMRIGHPTDKVDMIIMGGTFTSRPVEYQEAFVKECFDALNGTKTSSLHEAHRLNELADHRCVGLTVETRPDCFLGKEVDFAIRMGVTRVELGVQTVFNDVLRRVNRGHGVWESVMATKRAKEAGLKVCYHVMLGLPGSDLDRDLQTFRKIFESPDFRPDMLKIYPTLVIDGTELYNMWMRGEYDPLTTEDAIELLMQVKAMTPPWVRIQRIQRDVPAPLIRAGVKKSNLRQIVQRRMRDHGLICRCIRCREAGRVSETGEPEIVMRVYRASGGEEHFISFEDARGVLFGFVRLRFHADGSAHVRELKVFGPLVPLGRRLSEGIQHRGMGRRLMREAEEMARERGADEIAVTSGVGARPYYRRLGYALRGVYMVKNLRN